ncbi:PREDICTED: uncharacterized protein LOC109147628 [Ipomoea nil]|uniref:uncharacterized protein LOC109147628 n=1 Tax=Ipomoea nil TaxID=35883 RepID=UPI000900B116|nr:PREDICTED: uncharacterized protein LOC109147628 [Ipomoea nil]
MKVISWNCRGIVNGRVRKHVKELLVANKVDVCCLLEIRSTRADKMINLASSLGFSNHFIVNPLGFAGGLLLFWKQDHVDLTILSSSSQSIHTKVLNGTEEVFITFDYVRPNLLAKCRFWEECKILSNNIQNPWIVLGDLNDIAAVEEQWGSDTIKLSGLQRFVDAYSNCSLLDPGHSGPKFTWQRFIGNRVVLMRRLDRVLWNVKAQQAFPEGKNLVLPRFHSDHNPLMFIDQVGNPPARNLRPFRFEAAWLTRNDYGQIWVKATTGNNNNIVSTIESITNESKRWNRKHFGNIFNRKRRIEARIKGIQSASNYSSSRSLQNLDRLLAKEFNEILDQEEALWFQKSRMDWIKDGDRNTKFYHRAALIRRNKNRVRFLKIHGEWTDNPVSLTHHISDFFSSLLSRSGVVGHPTFTPIGARNTISRLDFQVLNRTATLDEVKRAVFDMRKFGSPGPDGIHAAFYQFFWNDIGQTLTLMVNQALGTGEVHKSLLQTFMTLIPKKEIPETAADFRPITLINVAFKVISKTLVNRLRPIMCKLIGPHQNSFLPGRSTMDNVVLTQEVIHTLNHKRGKKSFMVVKVDLHKAYDSVSWDFLRDSLIGFGFPGRISDMMGIPATSHLGSYLGMPILQKRITKDTFSSIIDKMRRKLANWKASALSMAGRKTLVQASLASIPTYTMQSMALPVSTCKLIDKVCRNFLWGHTDDTRKIHTVSWDDICKPKLHGGLGLRKAQDFNMAFLTKMAGHVLTHPDKLWVKIMKEKYVKNGNFFSTPVTANSSWGWRSIMKGKNILCKGLRWRIGTGASISFWHDRWVGDSPLAETIPLPATGNCSNLKVRDVMLNNCAWNIDALESLVPVNIIHQIRAIPIPVTSQIDRPFWPLSNSGIVTVSSAFSFISGTGDSSLDYEWIWRLRCKERVKFFIWKILHNGLLVNAERAKRGLTSDASCPRCGLEEESLDHLLRRCRLTNDCWNSSSPPVLAISNHLPLSQWIEKACSGKMQSSMNDRWHLLFPHILWNIWKARNEVVFDNFWPTTTEILKRARRSELDDYQALFKHNGVMNAKQIWVHWTPPLAGIIKLNSDGAKKATSSMASAGGLLRDHKGTWLMGFTIKIGITNSFVAELWGLREGLRVAKHYGYANIAAESDSMAVIQVLQAEEGPLLVEDSLILDCKTLLHSFNMFTLSHVLREGNQCADYLANLGQTSSWGTTILHDPPAGLFPLLMRDANSVATRRLY